MEFLIFNNSLYNGMFSLSIITMWGTYNNVIIKESKSCYCLKDFSPSHQKVCNTFAVYYVCVTHEGKKSLDLKRTNYTYINAFNAFHILRVKVFYICTFCLRSKLNVNDKFLYCKCGFCLYADLHSLVRIRCCKIIIFG